MSRPACWIRCTARWPESASAAGLVRGDAVSFSVVDPAAYSIMERAVSRGHGIHAGLEDTTVLPDGRRPAGNGAPVSVAAQMLGARALPSLLSRAAPLGGGEQVRAASVGLDVGEVERCHESSFARS